MQCVVCEYPSVTDINGNALCQNHYDSVRARLSWKTLGFGDIVLQLQSEWSYLVKAGIVEEAGQPEDQRLRASGAPELPGLE